MSLLFDQNLSDRLIRLLATDFPGSEHVRTVGLAAAKDEEIWQYAALHGLMVVSKDSDFQRRALQHGPPPKFVWLQMGNGPTQSVVQLLQSRKADIAKFEADRAAAMMVLP